MDDTPAGAQRPPHARSLRLTAALLLALVAIASSGRAQELRKQTVPFSAWLDFHALELGTASWPIWLESVEVDDKPPELPQGADQTTFRIRVRQLPGLHRELLLRLHFHDRPGTAPAVSAWSDTGAEQFRATAPTDGLNLPRAESLVIPMLGVDYVDIEVPGDGRSLIGAFVSSLGTVTTRQTLDLEGVASLADPFGAPVATPPPADDLQLYGRISATLQSEPLLFPPHPADPLVFEFDLEAVPLIALLSFDLLNADPVAPVTVMVNNQPLGAAALTLPDLADPAYRGTVRPLQVDIAFRYGGWIRCQKAVPGSALRVGANRIEIRRTGEIENMAVRAPQLHLKYNDINFDYSLKP